MNRVTIRPEFRDPGDEDFEWVRVGEPEKGRVGIMPLGTGLTIPPVYTVRVEWIEEVVR